MKAKKKDKGLSNRSLASFGVAALLAVTAAGAQVATTPATPVGIDLDTSGQYSSEVRACMSGRTAADQATCLQEARNAEADRKRGQLADPQATFRANARARCDALGGEDKAACEARMMGYGAVSGSVAGGGVLRQVETVVMPPGQSAITVDAKTQDPVVLVPLEKK